MKKVTLIALISIIINIIIAIPVFASDGSTNSASGVIYSDTNGNGMQDLSEEAISYAIVNVQELGSDLIESLITDEYGTFSTGDLVYGTYVVWGEANGLNSDLLLLEVNELNANAVMALGISSAAVTIDGTDLEMNQLQTIMLPLIMN